MNFDDIFFLHSSVKLNVRARICKPTGDPQTALITKVMPPRQQAVVVQWLNGTIAQSLNHSIVYVSS